MTIISDSDKFEKNTKHIHSEDTTPSAVEFDMSFEKDIRPKTFDSYIGQSNLIEGLKISVEASQKRQVPLDHILFYGPPGLGKTTLACVIANETGSDIRITSAPALERPRDIIGILMSLKQGEVLFIDEIHRLNKIAEEILYPAMEDFCLDMNTGKGASLKTLRVPVPKFTLIGATTKAGSLSGPLRDRFGMIHRLEFYNTTELVSVVKRTAAILNFTVTEDGAVAIARRSRGTPRIANRLVKRVGDFALVKSDNGVITADIADNALDTLNVDKYGLDSADRALLSLIAQKFNGGPVGIETIAAALSEDVRTIEEVYEPFLIREGLIDRTPRGRMLTSHAFKILNLNFPHNQQSLFT